MVIGRGVVDRWGVGWRGLLGLGLGLYYSYCFAVRIIMSSRGNHYYIIEYLTAFRLSSR